MFKLHKDHNHFLDELDSAIQALSSSDLARLQSPDFSKALFKVREFNLDSAVNLLEERFSAFGRPCKDLSVLLRSCLLMVHFRYTSVQKWHDDMKADSLLVTLCGAWDWIPSVGTYYSFMNRLWLDEPPEQILPAGKNNRKTPPAREKKKRGRPPKQKTPDSTGQPVDQSGSPSPSHKGEKLNLNPPGAAAQLAAEAEKGVLDEDRPNRFQQQLFRLLALDPSVEQGLIDPDHVILSGDGTAFHIHANSKGHHISALKDTPEFDAQRRYSDPEADTGFDSDLGSYYYGYTLYFTAVHNQKSQIDLPVLFSMYPARDHDSLLSIRMLNNTMEIAKNLNITHCCLDSASDNEATFRYCLNKGIIPVIDYNGRRGKDKKIGDIHIDSKGIPVCQSGQPMALQGFDRTHSAWKYRCPLVMGKIDYCPFQAECCKTAYGRTYYQKCENIREQTGIKYGSTQWKEIYKNRTSCERINNRILNDYCLHRTKMRGQRRLSAFILFACINIHGDAWYKVDHSSHE